MKLAHLFLICSLVLPASAFASIVSETVSLQIDTPTSRNEVFRDTAVKGRHPGILLLPEWWGITELERENARHLAGQGYIVMIVDLYGNAFSTMDPDRANARMTEAQADMDKLARVFAKSQEALLVRKDVEPEKWAVVGFGFGGGLAIDRARHGLAAKAVVDFFGGLNPPNGQDQAKQVAPEILVIVGEHDAFVTDRQFKKFRPEMKKAEARFTIEVLPNVFHDFIRPGVDEISKASKIPMKFDAAATRKAWEIADRFLARKLKD